MFVKKTFEVFELNYDAVFEDGGQMIFLQVNLTNIFLRNNEAYKLYYTVKDSLSVYNIRKVYFASLLSFLEKQNRRSTRFEIARYLLV